MKLNSRRNIFQYTTAQKNHIVLCYCISFHHYNVYVENFQSYVPLYFMYVDVWFASVRPK